jgi:hypothetical protein
MIVKKIGPNNYHVIGGVNGDGIALANFKTQKAAEKWMFDEAARQRQEYLKKRQDTIDLANNSTKNKHGKRKKDVRVITLLVNKNPKKDGSKSAKRFALYKNGMSVLDFLKAGGLLADINYDVAHKSIEVK